MDTESSFTKPRDVSLGFVSTSVAASRLGVPVSWLRAEIRAHRVPALVAGHRIVVHLPTAEQVLVERCRQTSTVTEGEA